MTSTSTQPTARNAKTESFVCPNCDGGLRYDAKRDKFLCTFCGYEGDIQAVANNIREYSFGDYQRRESESIPFVGISVAACNHCGSQITFSEQQIATVCPMCGSTQVDVAKQKMGIPPEGIIPFKVDNQAADVEAVGPFDTIHKLKPYAPEYLAGSHAEVYTQKAHECFETAKIQMVATMQELAESDICRRFDTVRSVFVTPKYTGVTYKHVLLPVWSSLFGYSGKSYRYTVNGETGKVVGQRPYSIPKIVRAVVIVLAITCIVGGLIFCGDASAATSPPSPVSAVSLGNNPVVVSEI